MEKNQLKLDVGNNEGNITDIYYYFIYIYYLYLLQNYLQYLKK